MPERPKFVIPRVPGGGSRPNPNEVPHLERGGRQHAPILHVHRADLHPDVRSYTDNLKAQLDVLLKKHEVRSLDDLLWKLKIAVAKGEMTRDRAVDAIRSVKELVQQIAEATRKNEAPGTIVAVVEGRKKKERQEIRFSPAEALKESRAFFTAHHLPELAAALPETIELTPEQEQRIKKALGEGFVRGFVFPAPSFNEEHTEVADRALQEYEKFPNFALKEKDQYHILEDHWDHHEVRNRRLDQPYLLLYHDGQVPRELVGITPESGRHILDANSWNGMTADEYILLQCREAERRGDRAFDEGAKWSWVFRITAEIPETFLLDSVAYSGATEQQEPVSAWWEKHRKALTIAASDPRRVVEQSVVRPTVVIPLEP